MSSSSLSANTTIDTGKPSVSSPTSNTLKPSSTINASIINNVPEVERRDMTNNDGKEGCRFDDVDVDVDDDGVSIWKGKEGFKVTELSTTIDRKRKTPVFIDFFLNDEIKSSTVAPAAAAAHQQPPPPHYDHPEEEYPDERTQLGLGWGPYIPITKTSTTPTTKSGDDEDPDLELRIGPPIQKRRRRRLFPDGYWEIKKKLTKSDANGSSRLLLRRKYVDDRIIVHLNKMQEAAVNSTAGMEIGVLDVDTDTQHSLVLKLWPSSCAYVLTKNWTCDFVKRRGLAENREIGLRWDIRRSRLDFAVLN